VSQGASVGREPLACYAYPGQPDLLRTGESGPCLDIAVVSAIAAVSRQSPWSGTDGKAPAAVSRQSPLSGTDGKAHATPPGQMLGPGVQPAATTWQGVRLAQARAAAAVAGLSLSTSSAVSYGTQTAGQGDDASASRVLGSVNEPFDCEDEGSDYGATMGPASEGQHDPGEGGDTRRGPGESRSRASSEGLADGFSHCDDPDDSGAAVPARATAGRARDASGRFTSGAAGSATGDDDATGPRRTRPRDLATVIAARQAVVQAWCEGRAKGLYAPYSKTPPRNPELLRGVAPCWNQECGALVRPAWAICATCCSLNPFAALCPRVGCDGSAFTFGQCQGTGCTHEHSESTLVM